jgi:hypothetical protein
MKCYIQDDLKRTKHFYRKSCKVQVQSTNIFDKFRRRLSQANLDLGNLMKSTDLKSGEDCHSVGKRSA